MSKRDYRRDRRQIAELQGKRCFLTLAMNSVKLHINKNQKNGLFIWIDPPWQFGQGDELIAASATYPQWKKRSYQEKHDEWCGLFKPIFKSTLERVAPHSDGSLDLVFKRDYRIFVPKQFIPSEMNSWYDHWYVQKKSS
jgi:hypothetical protein